MMAASWQKNLAKIIMQICFHISGICSALTTEEKLAGKKR